MSNGPGNQRRQMERKRIREEAGIKNKCELAWYKLAHRLCVGRDGFAENVFDIGILTMVPTYVELGFNNPQVFSWHV